MIRDLAEKSRSWRGYDESRAVTKEELCELVECARRCPAAANKQPLKYLLAWEKEKVDQIFALTGWAGSLPDMTLPHPGKHPTAFIVICHETNWAPEGPIFQIDVGIVAQTMLLAATEMGLGGIMIGNFRREQLCEQFDLPDHIVPKLVIALGKPDETVVLTEVTDENDTKYYRDENDVHYVPKRKLEDIIL